MSQDSARKAPCKGRASHSAIAKDTGKINPDTGRGVPNSTYSRGQVKDNFQQAVTGARKQVRRTWEDLQDAIRQSFGPARGESIIEAIVKDAPWSDCGVVKGEAGAALRAPDSHARGAREVTVRMVNATGDVMTCSAASLGAGEWANGPEGRVPDGKRSVLRTVSDGIPTGTSGTVAYRIGRTGPQDEVVIGWTNPLAGSNSYTCRVPAGLECVRDGGRGFSADVTFTIKRR